MLLIVVNLIYKKISNLTTINIDCCMKYNKVMNKEGKFVHYADGGIIQLYISYD